MSFVAHCVEIYSLGRMLLTAKHVEPSYLIYVQIQMALVDILMTVMPVIARNVAPKRSILIRDFCQTGKLVK